jgi:hypothetical protein
MEEMKHISILIVIISLQAKKINMIKEKFTINMCAQILNTAYSLHKRIFKLVLII